MRACVLLLAAAFCSLPDRSQHFFHSIVCIWYLHSSRRSRMRQGGGKLYIGNHSMWGLWRLERSTNTHHTISGGNFRQSMAIARAYKYIWISYRSCVYGWMELAHRGFTQGVYRDIYVYRFHKQKLPPFAAQNTLFGCMVFYAKSTMIN